jgi:hypothetical protein
MQESGQEGQTFFLGSKGIGRVKTYLTHLILNTKNWKHNKEKGKTGENMDRKKKEDSFLNNEFTDEKVEGYYGMNRKESIVEGDNLLEEKVKGYYGMEPEESLQTENYAGIENPYLNEHYEDDTDESK